MMNNLIWIFNEIIYLGATASILILMILLIKKIFNKVLSPKWHYYIWILLLIRLLFPIYPESSMSIYNVFYAAAEKVNLPVREIIIPFQGNLLNESAVNINNVNNADSGISNTNTDKPLKDMEIQKYSSTLIILAFTWLIGVLLLSLYTIYINMVFAVNVRKSYTPLKNERINDILEDCKNIMKIKHPIPLLTSKKTRTPSLYAFFNTKILVSEAYMEQLSDAEIKYIFLHELSHYKRKDIAANWILALLKIIYFFNPLIWYAFYKIHEDCEISCDAAALRYIDKAEYQSYGSTIIKLIRLFSESNFIPVTAGISKNKSSYKRRIIMISKFKKSKWTNTILAIVLISFVGLIGLTGCEQVPDNQNGTNTTSPEQGTLEPEKRPQAVYYGQWIISQVQAYGVGTYSGEDAESLLGKSLSFSADKASHFGDQLSDIEKVAANPIYTETVYSESDFVANYRIPLDNLGIKADSISEVTVSDSTGNVCTFFIKDKNTLILLGGGTYFELVRKTS